MIKTILGPPGCGKTHTNTLLVKQCIEDGIPPERIACVSFTRKAAQESKERVCRDLGVSEDSLPYFQTLHSMAFRAGGYKKDDVIRGSDLRAIGNAVGISFNTKAQNNQESDFDVLGISKGDQYLGVYQLGRSMRIDTEKSFNLTRSYGLYWEELTRLIRAYENYKKVNGKVDFTDMIENFIDRDIPTDVDALFVDEAQDLSTLQWDMVNVLRRTPRIQVFTGDDDQAIMGFQGADVRRFLGQWCIMARTNHIANSYADMLREEGWVYSRYGHPSIPPKTYQAILDWERFCKEKKINIMGLRNIYSFMSVGKGFKRGFSARSKMLMALDPETEVTIEEARNVLGLLADESMRWHQALDKVDVESQNYILNALKRGDNVKNPRIKISTIHSMKGGECDNVVVIPDLSPAAYNSYNENPDIEHRVFYVAVTRVKQTLHLMEPQTNKYYQI